MNLYQLLILSIHFLDTMYVSLFFSFLLDVKIFNKFKCNYSVGMGIFFSKVGTLGVLLAPLIKDWGVDVISIIFNIVHYISSFIIVFSLIYNKQAPLYILLFVFSFSATIINAKLKYHMLEGLEEKKRNDIIIYESYVNAVAWSIGNIISYCLYYNFGDNWKNETVEYVIMVAQIILSIKFLMVNFYFIAYSYICTTYASITESSALINKTEIADKNRYIPWIIIATRIIYAIGSGLSVKYFVLYMIDMFKMKPSEKSLISAISPILLLTLTAIIKHMEKYMNDILLVIIVKFIGYILLVCFVHSRERTLSLFLYAVRYPMQNCASPIISSVLLKNNTKYNYKWWISSYETNQVINAFSTLLGGIVSDKYGYEICFKATCVIYAIAQLLFATCYPLSELTHKN